MSAAVMSIPITYCHSCHIRIFWAKSPAGKSLPVDMSPVADGQYVLANDNPPALVNFVAEKHDGRSRYQSHFKSCTQASSWSRRGRSATP